MFDFLRKYNKFAMGLLFLLVIPSFVMFGVERYSRSDDTATQVAVVDGQPITRAEWDARHRDEVDRVRRQAPTLDVAMLQTDAARYATLERMVQERVLAVAATKSHLSASEERLTRLFAQDPGLASFRTADGKFDTEAFIRATGQSPAQYEAAVRGQLANQQVLSGITGSELVPPGLAQVLIDALHARREMQVARFSTTDFKDKVKITDADVKAWYEANKDRFQAPESVDIQYVVLDKAAVAKDIPVNEAELQSYYEQNKERFGTKEERRARHILIAAPVSESAAERDKAKAKAQELLARLKKEPDAFAEVAKKESQDPGSAPQGGELGWVTRGALVKPFEDVLFGLKKGEISPVVETEFGYHIIQLEDIKPGVVPPFAQVRDKLIADVRAQQAATAFAKAAESFTDMVYQQSDSLQPVADKFKLNINKAEGVARAPAPGATGALASRNFLAALFAADSLERKNNTEAIEVAPGELAAGRVIKHFPARTLTLDEVKDKVRGALVQERAAALAKAEGEARLAAWQADKAAAKLSAPIVVSRDDPKEQPAPVVEAALRVAPDKLPQLLGVDLGAQGYAVLRVTKALPPQDADPGRTQQEREQITQALATAQATAYYELLKTRYDAAIKVPRPTTANGVS